MAAALRPLAPRRVSELFTRVFYDNRHTGREAPPLEEERAANSLKYGNLA